MKLRLVVALVLLACAFASHAATRAEIRKSAEMSMLVTGTIDIEKDGSVQHYQLDQADKLPPGVVQLLSKAVPAWRFEPVQVDGAVVRARAKMGVRVIAMQRGDGNYSLRIGSASFGEEGGLKDEVVTVAGELTPPRYPRDAVMSGVQGTVYLVVKVGRDGSVVDVTDEQVNLTVVGNERQMRDARELLAKAAIVAGRKWRFTPPTKGPDAQDDYWLLRVPTAFLLCEDPGNCKSGKPDYGTWSAYIPGPKNSVPWISEEQNRMNPDALMAGVAQPVGSGPKLLTPVGEG